MARSRQAVVASRLRRGNPGPQDLKLVRAAWVAASLRSSQWRKPIARKQCLLFQQPILSQTDPLLSSSTGRSYAGGARTMVNQLRSRPAGQPGRRRRPNGRPGCHRAAVPGPAHGAKHPGRARHRERDRPCGAGALAPGHSACRLRLVDPPCPCRDTTPLMVWHRRHGASPALGWLLDLIRGGADSIRNWAA